MYLLLLTPLERIIVFEVSGFKALPNGNGKVSLVTEMAIMVPSAIWSNRDGLAEAYVP